LQTCKGSSCANLNIFTMLHLDVIRHTKCISSEIARPTSLDILDAIEVTGREKENP
jgi:hypothetical protein